MGISLLISVVILAGCENGASTALPYDQTHPVVYDNDSSEDSYTDELLMALHTSESINLRGMITTVGGWDEQPWAPNDSIAEHAILARSELVAKARRSGMRNVPVPVAGVMQTIAKPHSGRIADTEPQATEGSKLIVAEARLASPAKPLLIVVGGPVSTVADAFLLDPTIVDRVVVAWNGADNFNGTPAPFIWATEIVLRSFTCVLFDHVLEQGAPRVDKRRLRNLPASELSRYMMDKELPHVDLPGGRDIDAQPVIPLLQPDYVRKVVRLRWAGLDSRRKPVLEPDPNGRIWRVARASRQIAEQTWWRTMTSPASWGANPPWPNRQSFHSGPVVLPGRIEAENFDEGGPEIAYWDSDTKSYSENLKHRVPAFRVLEHVDFVSIGGRPSGYAVSRLVKGEWMDYTVDVQQTARYRLRAHVAPRGSSGSLSIGPVGGTSIVATLPAPLASQPWTTLDVGELELTAGRHVLRASIISGDFDLDAFEVAVSDQLSASGLGADNEAVSTSTESSAENVVVGTGMLDSAAAAEGLDALFSSGLVLAPFSNGRVHYVDSEELTAGYWGPATPASNAIDGNPSTFWNTEWFSVLPNFPHEIQVDLGAAYSIHGFRHLPRQDGKSNGRIAQYEFFVAEEGATWGSPVAAGTFADTVTETEILFSTVSGRYVRLRAFSSHGPSPYTASLAEFSVLTSD